MKYIFIDTNTYRHIFSENEGFSDDIKDILIKLIDSNHIKLLLPQQVKDEVERNRYEEWYLNEKNKYVKKIERNKKELATIKKALRDYKKEFNSIENRIESKNMRLSSKLKKLDVRYRKNCSKANQKLREIFSRAELIVEDDEIIDKARLRLDKGNPPKDNKLGDVLIWESLLYFLSKDKSKASLIFIANDNAAWGKEGFNLWLKKELKDKTNTEIIFSKAISDIKSLTKEEREQIKQTENEEQKKNALSDFLGVYVYINASVRLENLLNYKEYLTEDDYKQIISEFLQNSSVRNSYYTAWKVKQILSEDDNDYVVPQIENIDKAILDEINKAYGLNLKRHKDDDDALLDSYI